MAPFFIGIQKFRLKCLEYIADFPILRLHDGDRHIFIPGQ